MIGKNNLLKKQQKQGTRVETYSIKKFKVGAASVLVGVGIFFGAGAAQASDQTAENTAGKNTNVDAGASNANNANVAANTNVATEAKVEANTNAATEVKVETKEEAKAEVNANATAETKVEADKNTAAETKVDAENKEVEAKAETKEETAKEDKKEEAKPAVKEDKKEVKVDNTKLSNYISNIESNIQSGKYANKTDESLDELKKALANAKITAGTATSQSQLDKAYQTLVTTANSRLRNRSKDAVESKVEVKPEDKTEPKPETNAIANTGKNDPRNGKEINKNAAFRADVAGAASGIGADVEDATATPKAEKPTEFSKINAKELVKQINWLDFGDTSAWTNTTKAKDGRTALQVGSTYTKEIMPGYIVNIKVKSLKPFQATEIYKNRLEAEGATEAEKATYDPNAKNGYIGTIGDPTTRAAFANREEALVVADAQNRWTEIRLEGIDTGSKRTTISSEYNGANIGVQFEISATFRGKSVKPAVVAADGESANPGELVMFTTNGTGWKHIGEWQKTSWRGNTETYVVQDTHNYFDPANNYSRSKFVDVNGAKISGLNLELLRKANEVGPDKKPVEWKYFGSPDQVTGGLGTGVFGPNVSANRFSVPLVMTQGASEVGLYIASSGKQSAMLGFFPLDEGDAPESYGKAQHSIGTVDGVTGTKLSQPYLGSVSPDMDENNAKDWIGDDNTISADEGVDQILPDNLKGQTNDMIKLDRTRPGTYTLDVEAHTDGAAKAYIYGWIDFNQNGKFDEDERSDLATVTKDGPVRLEFRNAKTMIDPSVTELGTRVRIASNQSDIENPTGLALSGEVEDFKTQITFPPKGERKETIDVQGATQTATVAFTAQGLSKYSRDKNAEIDQTVAPVIIDNRTKQVINPKADGYYVIPGEGKYKVTPNGNNVDIEFTPEDNFVGTASGISIRRTDNNGYTTDWISKDKTLLPSINEVMDNMDGLYIPTVTPKNIEGVNKTSTDVQGATQTGTPEFELEGTNSNGEKVKVTPDLDYPAKLVDPATGQVTDEATVTVAGEGTYTIDQETGKVTFKPEPGFTGTANGVTVSVTAPVGRDKDGNVPADALKTATAKYTPTVTPITLTPTNKVSEDVQNVPQTQTPTFELSNDKTAEITSKKLVDPATGQPTDATTVTVAGEGSYTIDPTTGAVTFVPEKDFVGTAKGVTVQATATIKNEDGKTTTITADATYTPTVVPAVPTAQPAKSIDVQGATQKGKPTFEGTTVTVDGVQKPITIKENSYTLVDKDGNEVTSTPAYAEDGTTVIGTHTIDPTTGEVTFTPTDKSYSGKVTPVSVQAESSNGIKVSTTYTPEIVPVTPTAQDAATKDVQGKTQTGKPTFEGGKATVDGVEKTVEIDEDTPATFEDGSTTKTIPGEGTYTVAPDGTVTFVPEKSFTGKGTGVTVKRVDKNGTEVTAKYTPTVTPVTPTATPAESVAPQGIVQTGTVTFTAGNPVAPINKETITLLDENGQPAASVEAKSPEGKVIGTYTVDKATGVVTFTPTDKSYSGDVVAAKVQAKDANGTTVETTYTPKITPVTPTAQDAATKDIQGKTQTGTPTFTEGNPLVPIDEDTPATFEDGSKTKTIPGEGTYTVAPDGTVTFVPEKSFTGKGTGVTVKRVDKNGTEVTAKYTPTVTPVTPTADPAETTGKQGQVQTGAPTFTAGNPEVPMNDAVPATFEDGKTTKTVDGVGTYTVAPDGTVTFTPVPSFVGKAPSVTVVREDMNGTKASAKYTPTVTPVTPAATPAESVAPQGIVQTGTVTFTEGDPVAPINKDSITLLDENGQPAASVEAKSPEGKVIGTYTVDKATGVVTFTPTDKSYSGDVVAAKVQAKDANGTTVETTYTPKITPVTPTAQDAATKDIQGKTQTGTPTFTEGNPLVPIDEDTPATFEDGSTTKKVDGEGTYTVAPDGTVTFVPEKSFTGKGTGVTVKRVDKNGTEVTAKYTPTVTPVTPTADPAETTGKQGQVQTGAPTFTAGNPEVPMNDAVPATFEDGKTTKTVDGVGTYTVAPDGTVTFKPVLSFVGKAPAVTVVREDMNGTKASATYTPTVTPVTPTAEDVTSKDIQGKTQTGTPTFTEGDPVVPMDDSVPATFEDGSTTKKVDGEGTYTVAPDGTVTFVPEKSFTGTATGVTVKRVDKNGTEVTAKYTPTVTPVTPTADPAETTGKQGQVQTGAPTFTAGNPEVPMNDAVPATFEDGSTTKTVDGVGTYTVAPDGTVTFTPEPSFVGKAPSVTVVREDMNGTKASATYTPTVTPVTPVATPAESVAPQGIVQTGTVTFTAGNPVAPINKETITLLDENGKPAESVDAKSPEGKVIGKFTVDKETGVVTFTPTDKSYSGDVVPVKVQAKDANGTTVETTYTPKITPVAPTADPAESIGKQGQEQTGKPTFTPGNPAVPMNDDTPATFEDGKTTKTVDGVGTYTVAPDGTVTFKPVPSFVGEAPSVTVVREDMNGTKVSAKYTPTVTPVRPTGEEVTSEDIQGKTQTGKPTFTEGDPVVPMDDSVPATFEDGSTTKTIPGEGTYTVAPDGTVTFVPEKSFTGTATGVTVKRVDKNGTEVTAKYTPTVTPVTPTADPAETTGKQGQVQTGAPTFTAGNPEVPMNDAVPATFEDGKTTKTVDGVGTYTVAPDGTVTFKPVPSFVGKAPAVTVVRVDKNGTKASATYTPTVTPVTPTSEDVTSTDVQGKKQTGTPVFTPGNPAVPMDDKVPATFEDGSTTKKVDGEGTYTVAPDGTVTFVPEKSFTGTATGVTVKRVDKNGTAITAKYTPTVTPVTPTAEPAESIGPKGQEQTGKPTFTPGNPEVPMNDEVPATFEDGSTTKKVDGVGTYTVAKDGTVTFKPEPEFVGKAPSVTVVREDKNGTKVSATYTPTVTPSTKYVDNKGNAIPGYPEVDGTVEKKDIPGYAYVGTKTDEKGNTTHIYEKVVTPVPTPTPNEPVKPVVPSVEKAQKAKPQAKPKAKRLANTGEAETHSTLAGFGLLVLGGLVAAARRRKEK